MFQITKKYTGLFDTESLPGLRACKKFRINYRAKYVSVYLLFYHKTERESTSEMLCLHFCRFKLYSMDNI